MIKKIYKRFLSLFEEPFSYDKEFMKIINETPMELRKLEGISPDQLDFNKSAKKFLKNQDATADVSVDANANVDTKDVVGYTYELPKPLFKLNSLFILWEKLSEEYGRPEANKILRSQLLGEIYINDSSDLGKPYSYHPHTMVDTLSDGILSMEELFRKNEHRKDIFDDREVINLMGSRTHLMDENRYDTELLCVLRHKSHTDLLRIETKHGSVVVVTEDHPIILEDMSEIPASDLVIGDKLKGVSRQGINIGFADMDEKLDYHYLVGAMVGDGHTGKELGFTQKDVATSHFYPKFMKYFPNATVTGDKKLLLNVGATTKAEWTLKIGSGAKNKHLPYNLKDLTQRQIEAMLCGVIDSDGTVNKRTGVIDIRVTSYQLVQQIQQLADSELIELDNCRVSLVKHSQSGYESKLPMYRVSFSLPSAGLLRMSEKVREAGPVVYKKRKKDGRWEGTAVHKIEKVPYKGEWVYDIQTSTGTFNSSGLLCHNCFNYSTYDIVLEGLPMIPKIKSVAPKSLYAFKSQVEQFIIIASNSTLGATGLADILVCMGMYVEKIRSNDYVDGHIQLRASEGALTDYIDETLTSLIYTLNQPMRGNQCVTEDTEVLTPGGWKGIDELYKGDAIYTWVDGKMEIEPTLKVNKHDYDGDIHEYSSRDYCQVVSPNHRVLHKENNKGSYKLTTSSELVNLKTPLSLPVSFKENNLGGLDLSDEEIRLLAFMITEGSFDNGKVSISKSPNRWGNEVLKGDLKTLGITYGRHIQESPLGDYYVNIYKLRKKDIKDYVTILGGKKAIPSYLLGMDKEQAILFLDTWSKLDGSHDRLRLQCDTKEIRDSLQHIAVLAGYGSRQSERNFTSVDNKEKRVGLYLTLYKRGNKSATPKVKKYTGRIWCPTTEAGIVMFRKEGKVFISGNSPFTNVSLFDRNFLKDLCPDYKLPGRDPVSPETVMAIQQIYMKVMNREMRRTPITFPVTTPCFAKDEDGLIEDQEFVREVARESEEWGFMNFYSGSTSTLSSCCRLRSDKESEYFNSFGAGSTKIGSLGVVTLPLRRYAEEAKGSWEVFLELTEEGAVKACRINQAKRKIIQSRIDRGNMPLYTHGHMDLSKQYSTVGITGLYEAMAYLGSDVSENTGATLALLEMLNGVCERYAGYYKAPHNLEQVPAESSAIKLASKASFCGLNEDNISYYSNQFIPAQANVDIFTRMRVQGELDSHFSGGSIAHVNSQGSITKENYVELINQSAQMGVVYWAVNYSIKECEDGHMFTGDLCQCGKEAESTYTRVVGFLTKVSNWNKVRREEDYPTRKRY